MAKQQKFSLNDFQFDKELDAPNFDFDLKPPKDTRKPILKVASGIKEGVSESVRSNAFIKTLVTNALPRGYGSAYDLAEKSVGTLKSLYDDTTKEIRPFMNDLKRTTARLLPKVDEVMPKKLAEQVKAWTKTADANPSSSNYNPREAEISEMLAGMVGAQAQLQAKTNQDNDVKDRLREGLEQVRHRDRLKQGDALRVGISQLVDYQTNVTANYHRKSLELQYRHYFVALDALEEAKRSNAENRNILQAIVHNTGLPEQVKLKASDSFKDMAKKAAMGAVGNAIFGRTNEFITNLTGNLKKTGTGRVKNMFGMGRDLLGMANSGLDGMDMAEAMGMQTDPHHAAGQMGGMLGSEFLNSWVAKKLKPHLEKIPGIKKYSNKLQYGVENIPQMLNQWATSNKHEGGITDSLVRFLKANVRMSSRLNTGIQKDTVASMNEPSFFSRQASKSLTEIIPGYLARILREMQIMRTGDAGTELTHYDYNKNKFDSQSNVRKNAFNSLVKGSEKQWTTQDMESLLDSVDPKKTLNPEQRKILGQQLLRNNVKGRLGGVEVLGKSVKYDGAAAPHADQFSKLFRDHFKNDPDAAKKHGFAEKYNNLGAYANASREGIQNYANLGMTDFLDEAGLLHEDGDKANLEKYFSYFYGDEYNPAGGGAGGQAHGFNPAAPAAGGRRRRRRGHPGLFSRANRGGAAFVVPPVTAQRSPSGFNFGAHGMIPPSFMPQTGMPNSGLFTGHADALRKTGAQFNDVADQMLGALNGHPGVQAAAAQARHHASEMGSRAAGGAASIGKAAKGLGGAFFDRIMGGVTAMSEALKAIQERMSNAMPVIVVGNAADGSIPADAIKGGKKVRWWNRSIKDGLKGAAGGIWGGMKGAGKLGNMLVGGGFGFANGATRMLGGLAGKMGQGALDKMRGFRDVYSEETGPRKILLFAAKLKAGEYFDAETGHPIKSWKDIKGAVADKSGIVMTEEQARTAYVKDTMGKKAIKGLGAIIKTGVGIGNFLGGKILGGLPLSMRLVAGAGKLIIGGLLGYANGPQDVYVHDKEHPKRLRKALDARTMKAGGYSSGVTDKPIKAPHDIDGEVYNHKGVTVIDEEEFKAGLFDKNGNKLKHGIGRLLGGAGKILGAGFGAFKWLADGVNKGVGNMFGLGKGLLGGLGSLFGHHGIFFGGGKKLMTTVEEIRDLLKTRMPVPHKVRKGSVEDQDAQRKAAREEAWKKATGQKDGDGKETKGLAGLLGGLFKRKKKDDDASDDGKGGLVDDAKNAAENWATDKILSKIPGGKYLSKIPGIGRLFKGGAAHAVEGAAENAVEGVAKRGIGSAIGSTLTKGLKFGKGMGAGLALSAAGSAATAMGHPTIGKGLNIAGDVTGGWGLASSAAGLLGIEGGAMGLAGAAGGALLTGLGAIIASPVLLPALAIGAAGLAAYGGYKLLTRNKLDPMLKVRYAQYGWKPEDNSMVSKCLDLEAALLPGISYVGGQAQIDPSKVDLKGAVKGMGVDLDDKDQVNNFSMWYVKRFKPVFITHLSVLNSVKSGTKLSDADSKLSADEKKKYLDGVKMPPDTYRYMVSPSSDSSYALTAGPDEVKAVMDEVSADNDKDIKKDKDNKTNDKADKAKADAKKDAAKKTDDKPQPSWMDNLKAGLTNAWDKTKKFAGEAWDAAGSAAKAVGGGLATAGKAVGSFASNVISGAGDALSQGYDSAKKAGKLTVKGVSAALKGGMNILASLISRGEGNYSIANKPVGGSYPVAKGVDVSKMTIGQVQQAQAQRQIFAVGRYQLIPSTLADAVKTLGLSPDTPFSPEVQDKIFAEFLVGSKRPKIRDYLSGKSDDVAGAALAASQEWASIGTPQGMKNAHGQVSDGTTSYYAGIGGNKASISADEIMTALQAARKDGSAKTPVNVSTMAAGGAKSDGSTTTASTGSGAGGSGTSGGGIIKVADQTPGPAPAVKGPDAAAPAAAASGGSVGAPVSTGSAADATNAVNSMPGSLAATTASALGGFTNRNKDLAAQGQYQSDSLAKTLGPVSDVLKQSLDVQKQMLTALQQLVGFAGKTAGVPAANQKTPTGTASPDAMARKNPSSIPTPPVNMSKSMV